MGIKQNIQEVKSKIPEEVTLLAVSKTKPLEDLEEAYMAGMRDFGENKVQELVKKAENFHDDVRWHFIGQLQSNKVKYLVDKVYLIHSLSSISLLNEIEKNFGKANRVANTLIQINIGREESKSGILEENLYEFIETIEKCNFVSVKGIMVIIPIGDEESNRKYFRRTKKIFDELKEKKYKNISMNILSMGMTHDFITAIEEGSNLIRVGTGIFGERNYNLGGEENEQRIIKS
ncbi:YggS family pyridoxal phosphate-dependent enzyme [Clostridium sp.]|uniref:YggS family pyridoxal phosphate-dependent enzyme n=1 Tax=Clostridium sp. TaxID=1506 RepID=UPI0026205D31|nr:YggS family pyridoxal phosphate-dependent enzyme [Clostridium sp.]